MPVTITAGITFSGGGLTMVGAPVVATAGWYAGGTPGTSLVDRITFATDTATASVRGPLSSARGQAAGAGTFNDGWIAGGTGDAVAVDRITYATDTATSSVRGSLLLPRSALAGVSDNTTYGWYGGGSNTGVFSSSVQRITYATDTSTATTKGPLSFAIIFPSATGNTTYGWFAGGRLGAPSSLQISSVCRITYATDTATASSRGPLSVSVEATGAIGTTIYGWFGGGYLSTSADTSRVSRVTYATDTDTASVRGPLSLARTGLGVSTSGDENYGWFGGGEASFVAKSTIDRIEYATDTATATARGPLSLARRQIAGVSGAQ